MKLSLLQDRIIHQLFVICYWKIIINPVWPDMHKNLHRVWLYSICSTWENLAKNPSKWIFIVISWMGFYPNLNIIKYNTIPNSTKDDLSLVKSNLIGDSFIYHRIWDSGIMRRSKSYPEQYRIFNGHSLREPYFTELTKTFSIYVQ